MATGWLGWPPDTALDTPIGQIELALEGKIDFLKKTNPWGSADKDTPEKVATAPADPANAALGLAGWAMRAQGVKKPAKG